MKNLKSFDPSNGELLGEVAITPVESFEDIVARAHIAARGWKSLSISERVNLLENAYAKLNPDTDKLAKLLSREMGKDLRRSTGEVSGTFWGGSMIARAARHALEERTLGRGSYVEYKPLGVVAVISPWNYPLAMASNLIIPALVAGNTVVFKPSEETPLIAQAFVERLNESLPADVLQIVHGDAEQGKALVESNVNMIAFTGSQAAGKDIMARASKQLKRLVMELGGNDPMIVMADADIEAAARFAVASSLENAGQMCTSTERIYVDDQVAEKFEQRVVELASTYKVGPWDMPGVNIGPIINKDQHSQILQHIDDAIAKGAQVLLGGANQPERYIFPTVISQVTPDMLLEKEETFGPVVSISRFSTIEEAIERANRSTYALGAVVFGGEGAEAVADQLEAGMIGINQGVGGVGDAPWVGAKQSGFGFHGSVDGHRQFAQTRVINK